MSTGILTIEEVQEHIRDQAINNLLLDGEEYTPAVVTLAIELAVSEWNSITPMSADTKNTFPMQGKSLLMTGTLWKLFMGQAALLARNTMRYSDGGLEIPVEERWEMYIRMAEMYQNTFTSQAQKLKIQLNMEAGWGQVQSDMAGFPTW